MKFVDISKSFVSFYVYLRWRLAVRQRSPCRQKVVRRYPRMEKLDRPTVVVVDVEEGLLMRSSTFPYFMLVALEAGGFFRGLLLLVLHPLLCFVSDEVGLKIMVFVCFCGLNKEKLRVGRNVLPKFLLEDVALEGYEILRKAEKKVCLSCMPKVMVEGFLKDYLEVDVVIGRELKVVGGVYYTGFMIEDDDDGGGDLVDESFLREDELAVGLKSSENSHHRLLYSRCKETYLVDEEEKQREWKRLGRNAYPKPLVFHDGRIAFTPTPAATAAMFVWLPFGFLLAILRFLALLLLPFHISLAFFALSGMKSRLIGALPPTTPASSGRLFVCNHRTLLDPVYISGAINLPVTAVTYSLSRFSELISPIRTARLTRVKQKDKKKMETLLKKGDLVVCPEGTTCREPYLLRFSSLFTELGMAESLVPVAMDSRVQMFYGTTASGCKGLDSLFFILNPSPEYDVEFLAPRSLSKMNRKAVDSDVNGGDSGGDRAREKTANMVQAEIGRALGFQCTTLTRKDKYMVLSGNDGYIYLNN